MWKEIPRRLLSVHPQDPHLHPHHEVAWLAQNQEHWASPPYGLHGSILCDLNHSVTKIKAYKLVEWSSVGYFESLRLPVWSQHVDQESRCKSSLTDTPVAESAFLGQNSVISQYGENGWCNAWEEPTCHPGMREDSTVPGWSHPVSLSQGQIGS